MPPKTKNPLNSDSVEIGYSGGTETVSFPEAGMFIHSRSMVCRSDEKASIGHVIRALRKEKGISQEELARKVQVDRTTIARIECGIFKSVSMERLEGIAAAIGMDFKTLLLKVQPSDESTSHRGHLNQVAFSLDYPEDGFRIASLTPKRREFFFGRIEIHPQRTISSSKLPHPDQIYVHLLDGKMLLTRLAKELLLKAGDCFIFSGTSDYEFYNPDLLKSTSALFVTYPSFLPI